MKHAEDAILRPEQAAYLERLAPPRDPLLAEIEAEAARDDVPISDPEVGALLGILARVTRPRTIVEVGTAIGYGTLCLARGAPAARVVSIDTDPKMLARARHYLERAGVLDRVELVEGDAAEVLGRASGPFGLAYLDAPKTGYRTYLDLLLPRLTEDATVVVDNLLWSGRVAAAPGPDDDANTLAVRAFNDYFVHHPSLHAVLLPLSDGVGLATRNGRTSPGDR